MTFETKTTITLEIETAALARYTDTHLMTLWHAAQANPADGFDGKGPGELAEKIGREIIRRWLGSVEPELWHHQGHHHYWHELTRHGSWPGGVYTLRPRDRPAVEDTTGASDEARGAEGELR